MATRPGVPAAEVSAQIINPQAIIEAIDAETDKWQAIYLNGNSLTEVGRAEGGYYSRYVPGASNYDRLDDYLKMLPDRPISRISPDFAKNLRRQHDAQWVARPEWKDVFAMWLERDLLSFDETADPACPNLGRVTFGEGEGDKEDPIYEVRAYADGTLKLRVENPGTAVHFIPVDWEEIVMPSGISCVTSRVHYREGNKGITEEYTTLDCRRVAKNFTAGLKTVDQLIS